MEPFFVWVQAKWAQLSAGVRDRFGSGEAEKPETESQPKKPTGNGIKFDVDLSSLQPRGMPGWVKPALKWAGYSVLALIAITILLAVIGLMLGGEEGPARQTASNPYGLPQNMGDMAAAMNPLRGMTLFSLLTGFALGAGIVGFLSLWRMLIEKHGWAVLLIACIVLVLIGDNSDNPMETSYTSMAAFLVGFLAGGALIAKFFLTITPPSSIPNIFGTSRWATYEDLKDWKLLGSHEAGDGLFLGEAKQDGTPIIYRGDMHALTVAPTRTGKGATAIIPNLLRSRGSVLVIDPKGENARRTAAKRAAMGQNIRIVDPWGISAEADQYGPGASSEFLARFNPLDALKADDPELVTDVLMLADALIIDQSSDPYWSEEAKALIAGFILYVVTDPDEEGQRNLGRVRDILSLPPARGGEPEDLPGTIDEILLRMTRDGALPAVKSAAWRYVQKDERPRSSIVATAQSNTHFLESPRIRESLSGSDFRFSDLKAGETPATIYLVLPLDRLPTFNRWLRLLITSALIDLTRTPAQEGVEPVRVILDEFAALQKLSLVETAFGTMAGLGVQLWAVTQDFSQLMRLYGDKGWQTFISNAGVLQYFGSRDHETAKYVEHLLGMTTMRKRSISFGSSSSATSSFGQSGSSTSGSSETTSYDDVQRPLAYADEMMTLHRDLQVLFVENRYPIVAEKRWWFRHQEEATPSETKEA